MRLTLFHCCFVSFISFQKIGSPVIQFSRNWHLFHDAFSRRIAQAERWGRPLWMAPGWQCFQLDLKKRAENIANLAPCPGSNLTWVHQLWLSRNLVSMENHYDYEVLMVEAGAKDTVYVLYNFWVLTISVRRLDDFQERECRSHWVELMYHCQWHQVGNVLRSILVPLRMSPTWRHVEVPIWIDLTWVHHLWLSRNLVSMETHYDYEVLMVEAGAKDTVYVLYNFWVLTISVRRLDDFQERECRSHWVELMYHCQWHQVGNVFRSIFFFPAENVANLAPCWGSNLNQFDMGTSSMAEPKFGLHGDSLRLRSFDGGSWCKRHCICSV